MKFINFPLPKSDFVLDHNPDKSACIQRPRLNQLPCIIPFTHVPQKKISIQLSAVLRKVTWLFSPALLAPPFG